MSEAQQPIPELYREAAEQVRQLARQARLTDIRDDLLNLAAKFEHLAAYADAAIRLGQPEYHHGEVISSEGDQPTPKARHYPFRRTRVKTNSIAIATSTGVGGTKRIAT